MEKDFQALAEKLILKAQAEGASAAEAYFVKSSNTEVKVFNQKLDSLKTANILGVGLRTIVKERLGYAYSSELTQSSLEKVAKEAVENAEISMPDPYVAFSEPSYHFPSLDLFSPKLSGTSIEEKIEIAMGLEKAALDYDRRIIGSEYVFYADSEKFIHLANSKGFTGSYSTTDCYVYLSVVAEEKGQAQTGKAFSVGREPQALKYRESGWQAAEKAVSLLGASPIGSREAKVVFDSLVAAEFLSVVGVALTAEAVQKGRSPFLGKVNQKVASEKTTLIDDGALPDGIASAPFDGEGVPTQRTVLVEKGILKGFLHNIYTAKKEGVLSTGNAVRISYKSPPEVLPSNLFLLPGRVKKEELIAQTEEGFLVIELQGLHSGANPITGEFSVGAVGHWIENGKLSHPVGEVTIAGDMLKMLEGIDLIADDLAFIPLGGSFGSPTIRMKNMTISGK